MWFVHKWVYMYSESDVQWTGNHVKHAIAESKHLADDEEIIVSNMNNLNTFTQ